MCIRRFTTSRRTTILPRVFSGNGRKVSSPEADAYFELLHAIERTHAMIQTLEAEPPSPKRDAALELLRSRHAAALTQLAENPSPSHAN